MDLGCIAGFVLLQQFYASFIILMESFQDGFLKGSKMLRKAMGGNRGPSDLKWAIDFHMG